MTEREQSKHRTPLRMVEAYWHGLCDERQVPLRSEVDPRGIESALEHAFLIERIAPRLAKFRVAGAHLSDLMGMQVAGMPLSSIIAPADRDRLGGAVARLFADPAIVRILLRGETSFGKPAIDGELLLMPLESDFGDVSRGLGALITKGRIGRAPRRFDIVQIEIEPLLQPGVRVATQIEAVPFGETPAESKDPALGFAEARAAFETATLRPTERPQLKLVVSNDD
ncbi:PAS domain-containing protein [Thalassococcus lentus]|uniref:PAS domain-containing protein n=1 Tax=Thalassococcus lentus TaxID=1210524 RepID=A0ABT4XR07_9RHOB|nr:PAS domain-containing protein [Thalassococcus lentus]MDA7424273.1 PAS domain-containing protein [Thalassococcus lentus]